MRYSLITLDQPPGHIVSGFEDLLLSRAEWIQVSHRWLLVLYRHSGVAFVNAGSHAYEPGTAILFPPGCRGGHARVGPGTLNVYFEFSNVEQSRPTNSIPLVMEFNEEEVAECVFMAERIGTEFHHCRAALWRLLWRRATTSRAAEANDAVLRAERYVANRIGGPINVAEMCRDLDVPHRTLLRLFSQEHGTSIQRYITERRGREAARLLIEGNLSVKAVAARVGVPDLQQFNKLVRATAGISPRALQSRGLERPVIGARVPEAT